MAGRLSAPSHSYAAAMTLPHAILARKVIAMSLILMTRLLLLAKFVFVMLLFLVMLGASGLRRAVAAHRLPRAARRVR